MNKSTGIILSAFMNRRAKCRFTNSCSLYSQASYTCTHTGGSYCGKYRKLIRSKKEPSTKTRELLEVLQ